MRCAACGADYVDGDRFCGTCGERLPSAAAPPVVVAAAPVSPPRSGPAAGGICPVCGATIADGASVCTVCGWEAGVSMAMPSAGAGATAASRSPVDTSARVCPVHGPLDPSWTRCPYCLREGREGRLPSGPVGVATGEPALGTASPAPVKAAEARIEPAETTVPAAEQPAGSQHAVPAEPSGASPIVPPAAPPPPSVDLPRSSVGATFVVRRRQRVLAYLIEREGEAVGRVHQLDDDVTDIGRDPRNHIALTDVMISGFHARIERGPDGGFVAQDRQSTNGTFLNEEPLTAPRPFKENDALRVGNTTLVLKIVS